MNNREQFEAFLVSEYAWANDALNAADFHGDDATGYYTGGDYIYDGQSCSEGLFWAWRGWQAASKASEQQLTESRREFTAANATIHNLELKVAQVVAENAGLKSVLEEIINADEPEYHDQGMGCGVEDRGYQRDGYSACYYGWESAMERVYSEVIPDALPETPATDAAIGNIRAQGVEMLLASLLPYYTARADIEEFAAQLRQGAEHE